MDAVEVATTVGVYTIDVGRDIVNYAVNLLTGNFDMSVEFVKSLFIIGG